MLANKRGVFYDRRITMINSKMANQQTQKDFRAEFSYDNKAYYFKLKDVEQDGGLGQKTLYKLALPICRATVDLIKENTSDMDKIASRLAVDPKSMKLRINGFRLSKTDLEKQEERE